MRTSRRDTEFVAFVEAHRAALGRAAGLLTPGDHARAEDLVQTALTRLYVAWPRVAAADRPLAYAHRVLANAAVDEARRPFRRRERVVDRPGDLTDPAATDPAMEWTGTRAVVVAALAALPPGQRAVVVLRHWLDYSIEQTADLLDCSTGTVKSQNAKALAALRLSLADLAPISVASTAPDAAPTSHPGDRHD